MFIDLYVLSLFGRIFFCLGFALSEVAIGTVKWMWRWINSGWIQYFVEANAIALRRVSKEDMRHIAKATGATQVYNYSGSNLFPSLDFTVQCLS